MHSYKRALFWASIVDKNESRAFRSQMRAQIISNISAVHAANKDNQRTIFASSAALDIGGQIEGCLKNKNNVLLRRAWCFAQLNEFGPAQMDLDLIEVNFMTFISRYRYLGSDRTAAKTNASDKFANPNRDKADRCKNVKRLVENVWLMSLHVSM